MAKRPHPTGANPNPNVPRGGTGAAAPPGDSPPSRTSSIPVTPAPSSHLARRDMVLSLGHIHRSELPPTTASVITGCRGDPGTGGASLVTPVLPRRALTQHVQGGKAVTSLLRLCSPTAAMPTKVPRCFQPGCKRGKKNPKNPKSPQNHAGQGFIFGIKRKWEQGEKQECHFSRCLSIAHETREPTAAIPPSQEGSAAALRADVINEIPDLTLIMRLQSWEGRGCFRFREKSPN